MQHLESRLFYSLTDRKSKKNYLRSEREKNKIVPKYDVEQQYIKVAPYSFVTARELVTNLAGN